MWIEIGLWLGGPVIGAVLAWRTGLAPAAVMAMITGITIVAFTVLGATMTSVVYGGIDESLHDTYYVVATHHSLKQFGLLMIGVALPLALIARAVPYPASLGSALFVMLHIGAGLTLFPQRVIAATSGGMPRRYTEAEEFYGVANQISFVGGIMGFLSLCGIALASLVALYRMWQARKTV